MRTIRICSFVAAMVVVAAACGGSGDDVTIATDEPPEDPSPARAGMVSANVPPHGAAAASAPADVELAAAANLVTRQTAPADR